MNDLDNLRLMFENADIDYDEEEFLSPERDGTMTLVRVYSIESDVTMTWRFGEENELLFLETE